ncbi:hypothetical protein ABPG72_005696 [Tetrahymena utriculariae]
MDQQNNQVQATKEHCKYCFDVLKAALNNQPIPPFPSHLQKYKCPLFVTWHIDGDDLRGCIGTFQHENIEKILPQYAMISAFKDSRFSPITLSELPRLNVSVSLLVNFQDNKKSFDWVIGKHGIIIDFQHNGHTGNATFLPEVASDQTWDQRTTLEHLIKKAGYRGKDLDIVIHKIKLTTYESSKCCLDYSEYINM